MPKATVIQKKGKTKEIELKDSFLSVKAHEGLIHEAVRRYQAAVRQGTADTRTRSEVRGGGRKPWRQKGTGRARAGTIRSPLWKGGGVVFGPHPRDFYFDMPRKQRRRALMATLTHKADSGQLYILEPDDFSPPKTRTAVEVISKAGLEGKKLTVAVTRDETDVALSFRNLPYVTVVEAEGLNPYFVLNNDVLVITQAGYERLREVLGENA